MNVAFTSDQTVLARYLRQAVLPRSNFLLGFKVVNVHSQFTASEKADLERRLRDRDWSTEARNYGYAFHYDAVRDVIEVATDASEEVIAVILTNEAGRVAVTRGGPVVRA